MADTTVHRVDRIAMTRVSVPPTEEIPSGFHMVRFTFKAEDETFTLTAYTRGDALTIEEVSEADLFNWVHYDGGAA